MLRKKEINWFYQEGASFIYPDAWQHYLAPIPKNEQHDLVTAYYKQLTSNDTTIRIKAAKAWSIWEASTSKLYQSKNYLKISIDNLVIKNRMQVRSEVSGRAIFKNKNFR